MREKATYSWTQVRNEILAIWQDEHIVSEYGEDRLPMLLKVTAIELFKRKENSEVIRQAIVDYDKGLWFVL